jgi:TonB family protein
MARAAESLPGWPMTSDSESQLLPKVTLVLWLACLVVGIAGWWLTYAHSRPPPKQAEPIQAELVDIKIAREPSPALPPPAVSPEPPSASALPAPMPALSFATPTQMRTLPSVKPVGTVAPPATQQLIYGQGEAIQPAPQYPIEAQLAGQRGVVVIRFTVDQNGNVTSARAISPCPWPLLNQSAVRAVRETWHFQSGAVRSYEVSIRFVLRQTP